MKPLIPLLSHIFTLARTPASEPSQRLEALVISAWRERNSEPEFASAYPIALAFACGFLALTFLASYSPLTESASPPILLANAALTLAIHP